MSFYSKKVKEQYDSIFQNMDNKKDRTLTIGDILTPKEMDYYEVGLFALNNFIQSIIPEEKANSSISFSEYTILLKTYFYYAYEEANDNDEIEFIEEMIRVTSKLNAKLNGGSDSDLRVVASILYEEYYLKN